MCEAFKSSNGQDILMRQLQEIDPRDPRDDDERCALLDNLRSLEDSTGRKHVYVIELHPTFGQHTRCYPADEVQRRLERYPNAVPSVVDVIPEEEVGNRTDYHFNDPGRKSGETAC